MTLPVTPEVLAARAKWRFRGETRPPFADSPNRGQESVWDYPRPPRMQPDDRHVRIEAVGRLVAQGTAAIRVLETASPPTFYVPSVDVDPGLLRATTRTTHCEWKGIAREYDVAGLAGAAWTYEETYAEYALLAGYFAFYPGKVDCTVDGEPVRAQPGGYYGGWITPEIVGPFKTGDAATAMW